MICCTLFGMIILNSKRIQTSKNSCPRKHTKLDGSDSLGPYHLPMKCYLVHLYIRVTIWNYTRKQTKLRVNKKGSLDFFAPMHHEYFFIFFISTYVNKKSKQKQSTCCLKIIIYASFLTHIHEQCKCFMNKHHTLLRFGE